MSQFKTAIPFIALLAVIGLIGGAVLYRIKAGAPSFSPPAGAEMQAIPVTMQVIHPVKRHLWHSFSGRLSAVDYVEIKPQVSGTITRVAFKDGQQVNKGDVLYTVDARPYQAALDTAQAELSAARTQNELANKELNRAQELIKSNFISQKLLDERANATRVSNAAISGAQAHINAAQVNLGHTTIRAPISGRISQSTLTEGNTVQAGGGAPVLTSIVSNGGIYADFDVDEQAYVDFMADLSGQPIDNIPVKLSPGSQENSMTYEGKLHSFDNKIDTTSGTIRARALFSNDEGLLLPGMFVRVRISTPAEQSVILVAENAIGTDQSRKFVYVVDAENKAAYRLVEIGDSIDGQRVILSGLNEGDKVITEGVIKIRPGMPVTPKTENIVGSTESIISTPDTTTLLEQNEILNNQETPVVKIKEQE